MTSERSVRVVDAVNAIPPACRERSTARGLLAFARGVTLYGVAGGLLVLDEPLLLVVGWGLAGVAIASLFVLGHDAAHGALFESRRLCGVVGRLAMLPSLHAFSVWAYGHNRVHHAFATCGGLDAVWHPTTPAEWAATGRLGRLRHRLEWSCVGAGPYYGRAIWWRQLMRAAAPRGQQAAFRNDRLLVIGYAGLVSVAAAGIGWSQSGSLVGAVWGWGKLAVAPWAVWNVLIGLTVYLHHIDPTIRWARRERWSKFRGQVDGTTVVVVPGWVDFLSHNVFHHVAHHVDPRVPYYHLPAASGALRRRFGTRIRSRRFGWRDYARTTRRCKLFDFDREVWLPYPKRADVPAISAV